jgi:hypothetical protein
MASKGLLSGKVYHEKITVTHSFYDKNWPGGLAAPN